MNLNDILQQYAQGERTFHRVDLREAEILNQNLQNLDFTQADLRQASAGEGNTPSAARRDSYRYNHSRRPAAGRKRRGNSAKGSLSGQSVNTFEAHNFT